MRLTTFRTANEIINSVLLRIGNLDLQEEAQAELNSILDWLTNDYKWPFLIETVEGTIPTGANDVDLPEDFSRANGRFSINFIDESGNKRPAAIISDDELDMYPSTVEGTPLGIHIDTRANTFRAVTYAGTSTDYTLSYQIQEAEITNFDLPVNFPHEALITKLLFVWACEHEDDDRYTTEVALADAMLKRFVKRFSASPSRNSKMAYNPRVYITMGVRR